MSEMLNKSFFRFVMGFFMVIIGSFVIVSIALSYDSYAKGKAASVVSPDEVAGR